MMSIAGCMQILRRKWYGIYNYMKMQMHRKYLCICIFYVNKEKPYKFITNIQKFFTFFRLFVFEFMIE